MLTGGGDRFDVRAVRIDGLVAMVDQGSAEIAHDAELVRQAARGGRPVLVTGAAAFPAERGRSSSPHQAAVSVTLVVPIRMHGNTIGAIYVEHREPVRSFGSGHQEAVVTVCTHAAAALWSLELEGRLQRADQDRQSLVEAQSRFISADMLRILDISDLSRVRRGHRVERQMTVLISDIRGYTGMLEGMSVAEASELMLGFLCAVEVPIITSNGLLQDVRGDEILAVFDREPDDAVRAGLAMLRSLREHNRARVARGSEELRVGIGVNTGRVGVGLVGGVNRMALTVIGDAVNLASRVESTTKRYGSNLLISEQTFAGLVDPTQFDIRRMERVMVVNRRRPVTIYEVFDEDPEPVRAAKRAAQPVFDEAFAWFDAGDVRRAQGAFERCRVLLPDDQVAPLHVAQCEASARGGAPPGPGFSLVQK
jgi:class 3 adenylate cyclase